MKYKIQKYTEKDKNDLFKFIINTERLFNPPISERVNLNDYINKLILESEILVAKEIENNKLIGVAAYYCTPNKFDYAFLSFIAVNSKYKGVGSLLIQEMIEYCKYKNMKGIETQTWESNERSLSLFKKFDFVETDRISNRSNTERSILLKLVF